MSKQILESELDAILTIVKTQPEGMQISALRKELPYDKSSRTLLRHLNRLVEQKRLIAEGKNKGRRYRIPITIAANGGSDTDSARTKAKSEVYPPISPEAETIKEAILAPIPNRQPVGYQRIFLDDYRPNVTYYLPQNTRKHLHDIGRPAGSERLAGTFARTIFNRLLIDLSWNSSRLEGNTYSLLETERLLELGEVAEGKNALEAQMILNHKSAIELLVDHVDEIGFNRYTILNLHALLSDNLLADPQACGRLRQIPVSIQGTVYHPLEVPALIEDCFGHVLDVATVVTDPFEQAFFALVHLAYLQGFQDVNKRVSRLAANIPLMRNNLCPLSFVDVPLRAYMDGVLAIYELNRVELLRDVFVWAYERSSARYSAVRQSLGEPDPFRLRYRVLIAQFIAKVVREKMNRVATVTLARQYAAEQMSNPDQARFVEVVETEIMSLHEGNIARYRLRLSEYQAWRQNWV